MMEKYLLPTFNVVLSSKEHGMEFSEGVSMKMANVFNSNLSHTPTSLPNELDKISKGSTKLTSKQTEPNHQNSGTPFHSNNVDLPSTSEHNSPNSSPSNSTSVTEQGKYSYRKACILSLSLDLYLGYLFNQNSKAYMSIKYAHSKTFNRYSITNNELQC
jgi:hypothetical protein